MLINLSEWILNLTWKGPVTLLISRDTRGPLHVGAPLTILTSVKGVTINPNNVTYNST